MVIMKHLFQAQLAQKKRAQYMNLQAWRQSRTTTMTLQSGLEVVLKKASLLDLAMNGEIPNTLAGVVDDLMDSGKTVTVKVEDFGKYGAAIDMVVKACVVEPALADEPDETHIGIREIPAGDRIEIFTWANEGVEQVAPFRAQTGERVATVLDESSVRAETIGNNGNHG